MFRRIGLPDPEPVALMPLSHQIAQKLHGLTEPESKRAHDLIDPQIIMLEEEVDLALARRTCERLFSYRRMQAWPPTIRKNDPWEDYYKGQQPPESVLQSIDEAITWGNALIDSIAKAR